MNSEEVVLLIIGASLTVIVFVCAIWIDKAGCESRWASSGMATSYGPIQGCLVQRKDGSWMPDSAYRQINN